MRIKAALIILAVLAVGAAAFLLVDTRTLSASRLEATTQVCKGCHMRVPEYETASYLHGTMSSFECSRCHGDNAALKTTDGIHTGLQRLGIGFWVLALAGSVTSAVIFNRRNQAGQ